MGLTHFLSLLQVEAMELRASASSVHLSCRLYLLLSLRSPLLHGQVLTCLTFFRLRIHEAIGVKNTKPSSPKFLLLLNIKKQQASSQAKSPIGLGHTLALFSLKLDAKKLN